MQRISALQKLVTRALNGKNPTKYSVALRNGLTVGLAAFLIALPVGLISDTTLEQLGSLTAAFLVSFFMIVNKIIADAVGDVSGSLIGAIGIAIVYQLFLHPALLAAIMSTTLMSATVASLIVGGKAYGKVYAVRRSCLASYLLVDIFCFQSMILSQLGCVLSDSAALTEDSH